MEISTSIHHASIPLPQSNNLPTTYFELIQKVGSHHKYQSNMLLIHILILFTTGTILVSTAFLFMNDQYACSKVGLLVPKCQQTVCLLQNETQRKKYFVPNKDNIKSIATQYGPFMCQDQFMFDMIKSLPYFGSLIGFIISSFTTDIIGRKTTITVSLAITLTGSIIIVTGFNLLMVSIGVVLAGAGINIASAMTFCFLGQTVQDYKRQKYSILVQVSYTIGAMCKTGMYYLIGNWRVVSIILNLIPCGIVFFILLIYAQQTPLFLLRKQNKQVLKALNRIGYINYGIKDIITQEDIQNVRKQQSSTKINIKQNKQLYSQSNNQFKTQLNTQLNTKQKNQLFSNQNTKSTPLDLIRYKSLRTTIILSCLMGFVIFNMYYGPALIIDSIGFNTYISSFIIQLPQLIGYLPCYYYIEKVNRKTAGFWLFIVTILTSLILIFINKPNNCNLCLQSIIQIILIFIFRFAVATQYILFLVYTIQLFPTKVVGIGVSAINCSCTIASTLVPILLGALQKIQFNRMMFFFICGIVGCSITILLKQTKNQPIQSQILQIIQAKNKYKIQKTILQIHKLNSNSLLNSHQNI